MKKYGRKWRRINANEAAEMKSNPDYIAQKRQLNQQKKKERIERQNKEIHKCFHYFHFYDQICFLERLRYPKKDMIDELPEEEDSMSFEISINRFSRTEYGYKSLLKSLNARQCICKRCGRILSKEKMAQMNKMLEYIKKNGENEAFSSCKEEFLELYNGLEGVKFRGIHNKSKEIVEIITDPREFSEA